MPPIKKQPISYIKHQGLFDFNKILREIHAYATANRYNFFEKKHKHRPNEREVEILFDRKVNEYIKYSINILIRAWDVKDVTVAQDGKERKLNQGRIAIEVQATLTLDYGKRFGGSEFLQKMQDMMHRTVMKKTIEDVWEIELLFETNRLLRSQFMLCVLSCDCLRYECNALLNTIRSAVILKQLDLQSVIAF